MPKPFDRNSKYNLINSRIFTPTVEGGQINDADINDPDIDGGTVDDSAIVGGTIRNVDSISTDSITAPPGRPSEGIAEFQDVYAKTYNVALDTLVYETRNTSLDVAKRGGISDPSFNVIVGGVRAYQFANNKDEELFLTFKMPNNYLEGQAIQKSLAWIADGATTGVMRWGIECFWENEGDQITSATTIYVNQTAPGVDKQIMRAIFPSVEGTGKEIGSEIVCRIFRDATSGTDVYTGSPWGLDVCIDYPIAGLGGELCI